MFKNPGSGVGNTDVRECDTREGLIGWIRALQIAHEYRKFLPRNPGSFDRDQVLTLNMTSVSTDLAKAIKELFVWKINH